MKIHHNPLSAWDFDSYPEPDEQLPDLIDSREEEEADTAATLSDSPIRASSALDNTPLTYKKHAGRTPVQVLRIDPSYLVWMMGTGKNICSPQLYEQAKVAAAKLEQVRGTRR